MPGPPTTPERQAGGGPKPSTRLPHLAAARDQARKAWTHPANAGHRVAAVWRVFRFRVNGRVFKRRMLASIGEHGRMWCDIHQGASRKVVDANPPDWEPMQAWRRYLRAGDRFVDVGANIGVYTLWVAGLGARIVAVEPHPTSKAMLEENLALNDFDVTVIGCALSEVPGTMRLTANRKTMNQLIVDASRLEGVPSIEVEVRTLDEVIGAGEVAGIKIDVEGAERLVLAGGRDALSEGRIAMIQMEWNLFSERLLGETRAPIVELLAGYGYTFHRPDHTGRLQPVDEAIPYGTDMFAVAPGVAT